MVIALYGVVLPQSAKAISNDFTKSQNYCIQSTCDVTLSKEITPTEEAQLQENLATNLALPVNLETV